MSILKKLPSIFTKKEGSEVFYLTKAVDNEANSVVNHVSVMELQSVLLTSTGEWLNMWGDKFGIGRKLNETDDAYRKRIMDSVTALKGTIPALISAVKRALGEHTEVLVKQTYEDLRIFNVSTFSGTGKFQDSDTVRLGVIILKISEEPNDRLREEIFKSKSMGTRVIIEVMYRNILPNFRDLAWSKSSRVTVDSNYVMRFTTAQYTAIHCTIPVIPNESITLSVDKAEDLTGGAYMYPVFRDAEGTTVLTGSPVDVVRRSRTYKIPPNARDMRLIVESSAVSIVRNVMIIYGTSPRPFKPKLL